MVYIMLAEGFEESEAIVPADLLRRAGIETALVSVEPGLVRGSHGICVQADLTFGQIDLSKAEMIVLPGGLGGVKNLSKLSGIGHAIQLALEEDKWVAAICAAPTLLAKRGFLQGKKAVCYPGMEDQLEGAEPQMERGVVVDRPIITGRAAGSAFDFGLELVKALAGEEKAKEVRDGIHY